MKFKREDVQDDKPERELPDFRQVIAKVDAEVRQLENKERWLKEDAVVRKDRENCQDILRRAGIPQHVIEKLQRGEI